MAEEALLRNFQLVYALHRIPMAAAVLHLGAHPDDEDTGMLALVSRGRGARAVYWSATRGEGAQNYVGPDRNERLGIVRTWESLAAREYDGGEVLYGPFIDFGFTKTGEFALARWNRDAVLREIVRTIRLVRPAVVVSRWAGTELDGHGHHQAIGLVAEEAFDAAADRQRYPELRLPPWTALKLYHSMGGDWQPGEDVALGRIVPEYEARNLLRLDTGELDPISGHTFQELAWKGYNRHQSQAMGFVPEWGDHHYYYALDRTRIDPPSGRELDLFDGIDMTLAGLPTWPDVPAEGVATQLTDATAAASEAYALFHPSEPTRSLPGVLAALAAVRDAIDVVGADADPSGEALVALLRRKEREIQEVAAQCSGLQLEASLSSRLVNPGSRLEVAVRLWNKGATEVADVDLGVAVPPNWSVAAAPTRCDADGHGYRSDPEVTVSLDAPFSCPHWLRERHDGYRYVWSDPTGAGQPLDAPQVCGTAMLIVDGHRLDLRSEALMREAFGGGYRELPAAVLPPIALAPARDVEYFPITGEARDHQLRLALRCNHDDGASGQLELLVPEGWTVAPPKAHVEFTARGDTETITLDLQIPDTVAPGHQRLDYRIRTDGLEYGATLYPVRAAAPGLARAADEITSVREVFITEPAAIDVHVVDVEFVRKLEYGYITGADEGLLAALRHFDLDLHELDDETLEFGELSRMDAIVVGPNAYIIRDVLRTHSDRLLDYVRSGGTVIVQHQGYGFEGNGFAPLSFKFHQPHDRVTFEDAPVRVLRPDHALFRIPNEIGDSDWEGWVKDRGMYFFGEFDDGYVPLVECNDPGEAPQRGGLLVADVGQGNWVYCAYSLWKQIPAGVAGAFRLFANLLALPHSRILTRARLLKNATLFGFMDEDQRYDIARLMADRRLEHGEILCRQREPGDEMYVIVDGDVEVVKEDPTNGDGTVIAVAGAGEAIGELSVLASRPRSATMRARGPVRLLSIQGPAFRDLLHRSPEMADRLIRTLVDKLAITGLTS